ncbi:ABC transporter permease [Kineosporia succinea]|uniref:Autoinducer 2 import system permease protein LsrC n=1 Tax=Kineosporia succinea TaxID=84632 RepID=A0ABT9PE00_9ACTN|nr:ABC transporter permease [Kineosporia succinea]MDP9830624.1 rhamnose transport system permease protein [Kineosporia succinea]
MTPTDTQTELLVEPSALPTRTRLVKELLRSRELSVGIVLLLVVIAAAVKSPDFVFGSDGWRDLLLNPSILLLLAAGQTVVIVTRNVDLSVGSILGLTAWLTGEVFISNPGMPPVFAFLIGTAAGAGLGLINGVVVAFGKVPALVITLGTQYIFRGVVITWAGSGLISAGQLPKGFLELGTKQVLTFPVLFLVAIVIVGAVGYYLTTARSGRELYAVGSDPEAAVLYGLPVTRRVVGAFVLSGALAGLAGVLFAARYGTVNSSAGTGIEFQAVAAAVVGGVAIFGGSGTVWGAAIGAGLLVTINSALPMVGISEFWQQALVGALIIAAIVLDRVLAARQARKLIEARDAA